MHAAVEGAKPELHSWQSAKLRSLGGLRSATAARGGLRSATAALVWPREHGQRASARKGAKELLSKSCRFEKQNGYNVSLQLYACLFL
jgi:hypothetical protein